MRPLLSFALCGALSVPGAAVAQAAPDLIAPPPPSAPVLKPLPTVEPTAPAPEPVTADPPPPPVEGAPAPTLATPTAVAPVLAEDGDSGLGDKVGAVIGGTAGGAAGAAAGGPVGKFVGSFVGKRLATSLFGGDKIPDVKAAPVDPAVVAANSAAAVAMPAVETVPAGKDKKKD